MSARRSARKAPRRRRSAVRSNPGPWALFLSAQDRDDATLMRVRREALVVPDATDSAWADAVGRARVEQIAMTGSIPADTVPAHCLVYADPADVHPDDRELWSRRHGISLPSKHGVGSILLRRGKEASAPLPPLPSRTPPRQRAVMIEPMVIETPGGYLGAFHNSAQRGSEPVLYSMDQTPSSRARWGVSRALGPRAMLAYFADHGHLVLHRSPTAAIEALRRTTPIDLAMRELQNV